MFPFRKKQGSSALRSRETASRARVHWSGHYHRIQRNLFASRELARTRGRLRPNPSHKATKNRGRRWLKRASLRRSAFSPNIKERRDYSCAVYDAHGQVLAMGDHMPVHLGSMPASVASARHMLSFESGDIAALNDPFAGGTHLPDVTLVMPVFLPRESKPHFFVASRAHHADIGGALAG